MSENLPEGSDGVPHYCPYVGCRCVNKYLTRRYCREFENGNQIQSQVYFSKAAKWDASRLQEELEDCNLQETKDQATFCCETERFVAKLTISSLGEKLVETDLKVTDQKCSAMTGPPPHLPYTLHGSATRNMKACLMIIDGHEKIILQLPLHSKDFHLESRKLPQENGEMELVEHLYASGQYEAYQNTEESQRV